MKKIKLLCFLLVAVMLFPLLFSCTKSEEEGESESESTPFVETVDDSVPEGRFPILKDGKYTVRVIMPDIPSDTEKAVYTRLLRAKKMLLECLGKENR